MRNARKGFTLVELIVVLVIIGILAAIAYVAYSALIGKSKTQSIKTTAETVDSEAMALGAADQLGAGSTSAAGDTYVEQSLKGDGYTEATAAAANHSFTKGSGTAQVVVTEHAGNTWAFARDGKTVCYTPSAVAATKGSFTEGACAGAVVVNP